MAFNTDIIARMELFACLVSIFCFRKLLKNKLVTLYTDNTNARDWIIRRRSDNPLGNTYLIILELLKYSVECKLSTRWIPSTDNRTADLLSRGGCPRWLRQHGRRLAVNYQLLQKYLEEPVSAWRTFLD